jgi:hypothetical protein
MRPWRVLERFWRGLKSRRALGPTLQLERFLERFWRD